MSRAKKYPQHLKMAAKTISKWPKWKREIISNKSKKPKPARVWKAEDGWPVTPRGEFAKSHDWRGDKGSLCDD